MDLKSVKKNIGEVIENAKTILARDGYLDPTLFSIVGEKVTPLVVRMNSEDEKEEVSSVMKTLAKDADFIVLLMDSYMLEFKGEIENLPETLKEHDGTVEAIVTFLYVKGESFMREVPYAKKDDGGYCFFDTGWKKAPEVEGKFVNPF